MGSPSILWALGKVRGEVTRKLYYFSKPSRTNDMVGTKGWARNVSVLRPGAGQGLFRQGVGGDLRVATAARLRLRSLVSVVGDTRTSEVGIRCVGPGSDGTRGGMSLDDAVCRVVAAAEVESGPVRPSLVRGPPTAGVTKSKRPKGQPG